MVSENTKNLITGYIAMSKAIDEAVFAETDGKMRFCGQDYAQFYICDLFGTEEERISTFLEALGRSKDDAKIRKGDGSCYVGVEVNGTKCMTLA